MFLGNKTKSPFKLSNENESRIEPPDYDEEGSDDDIAGRTGIVGYPYFSLRNPYEGDITRYKIATQNKINMLTGGFEYNMKSNLLFIIFIIFINKILY